MSNKLAKIDFHGDEIVAFEDEKTGKIYASIRRMCECLGIQFSTQRRPDKSGLQTLVMSQV